MKTSVKQIYDALCAQHIDIEIVQLSDEATLLLFTYEGKLRAISGTSPDLTSSTGRTIANNKYASAQVARRLDIPLPETVLYEDDAQARAFLERRQVMVVKPLDAAHGNGVTTAIRSVEQLQKAVKSAQEQSSTVLLQQQVSGTDLRILVIGGELAAVAERVPAKVVGDGQLSIAALIAKENDTNPLRGVNYEKPLNQIDVTAAVRYIGEDGMLRVPDEGESVQVVGTANIGTGGHAVNRTGEIPAQIVEQAVTFAKETGAFMCGVDFLYDQTAQAWYFIEANSSPSLGLHLWPTIGESVDVTTLYVDRLLEQYRRRA